MQVTGNGDYPSSSGIKIDRDTMLLIGAPAGATVVVEILNNTTWQAVPDGSFTGATAQILNVRGAQYFRFVVTGYVSEFTIDV